MHINYLVRDYFYLLVRKLPQIIAFCLVGTVLGFVIAPLISVSNTDGDFVGNEEAMNELTDLQYELALDDAKSAYNVKYLYLVRARNSDDPYTKLADNSVAPLSGLIAKSASALITFNGPNMSQYMGAEYYNKVQYLVAISESTISVTARQKSFEDARALLDALMVGVYAQWQTSYPDYEFIKIDAREFMATAENMAAKIKIAEETKPDVLISNAAERSGSGRSVPTAAGLGLGLFLSLLLVVGKQYIDPVVMSKEEFLSHEAQNGIDLLG